MRDPNRIDEFCATLAELWHKVPDWRFGQFVWNIFGKMFENTHTSPFYVEDEVIIKEMQNYFKEKEK